MRLDARGPSEAVRSGHVGTGVRERDCPGVRPRRVGVPEMLCVRVCPLQAVCFYAAQLNLFIHSLNSPVNSAKYVPDYPSGEQAS